MKIIYFFFKINQKSVSEKTVLHVACHQGHPEIVSFLLEEENNADKEIKVMLSNGSI